MGLQIVSIIGNATKDAELKVSKDGISYVTFRLAVSGTGDKPTFFNIVIFGHYGEVIREHITKGREIFVNGRLEVSEKGYISVVADHIELLRWPKAKAEKAEPELEKVERVKPKKSK